MRRRDGVNDFNFKGFKEASAASRRITHTPRVTGVNGITGIHGVTGFTASVAFQIHGVNSFTVVNQNFMLPVNVA